MADKRIDDLTDGGVVQSGDNVHIVRGLNSRKAKLGTAASSAVTDFATAAQGGKADTAVQPARQVGAGTGLTGGGDLSADRTLALSSGSIASLAKADTAVQPGALGTAAAKNTGTAAGNVPLLDSSGLLPTSTLPAIAITDTFEVASQAAMLALSLAEQGDVAVRSDLNKTFILKQGPYSTLANWVELKTPTDAVLSVASRTGAVTLSNSDVGLGNVDNTSDANKPVSTAQLTALNLKASLASPALTGSPTAPTQTAGDNSTKIATTAFVAAAAGGGGGVWVDRKVVQTVSGSTTGPAGSTAYTYSSGTPPTTSIRQIIDGATLSYSAKRTSAPLRVHYACDALISVGSSSSGSGDMVIALYRDSGPNAIDWQAIAVNGLLALGASGIVRLDHWFNIVAPDAASHTYTVAIISRWANSTAFATEASNLTRRLFEVEEAA